MLKEAMKAAYLLSHRWCKLNVAVNISCQNMHLLPLGAGGACKMCVSHILHGAYISNHRLKRVLRVHAGNSLAIMFVVLSLSKHQVLHHLPFDHHCPWSGPGFSGRGSMCVVVFSKDDSVAYGQL